MSNILLGLIGKGNSGKSIVTKHLCDVYGFKIISREDFLKNKILESSDFSYDKVFSGSFEENSLLKSCMSIISKFYTENCPLYITNCFREKILKEYCREKFSRYVIPDLCLKKEFDFLFKDKEPFRINVGISNSGILIESLFKYKLIMDMSAEFGNDYCYNIVPCSDEFVGSDLFLHGKDNEEDYLNSLDRILFGLLEKVK